MPSSNVTRLCGYILKEIFGDVVRDVGEDLCRWNGQTLANLTKSLTSPTLTQMMIREALVVLVRHNLVTFVLGMKTRRAEYTLHCDRVVALIRYPRHVLMAKTLFGDEGEVLTEEIYSHGQLSSCEAIFYASRKLKQKQQTSTGAQDEKPGQTKKSKGDLGSLVTKVHKTFREMVECHFLQRSSSPYVTQSFDTSDPDNPRSLEDDLKNAKMFNVPLLTMTKELAYLCPPNLDLRDIILALDKDETDYLPQKPAGESSGAKRTDMWRINYDRFDRELRDLLMVQAVGRRVDASAGNLLRVMLNLMNEQTPWNPVSCRLFQSEIFSRVSSAAPGSAVAADAGLQANREQYLRVLEEGSGSSGCGGGFVKRVGDARGGEYVVDVRKAFEGLAAATIDSLVLERFGSKTLRIFRVIREKRRVEETQLQELVMIPSKEVKLFTYELMENTFVQLQELRKSLTASSSGPPSKSFHVFYVDTNQVCRQVAEMCYKTLANCLSRRHHEHDQHSRLLDKEEKIESIAANLRASVAAAEDGEGRSSSPEELELQLQEIHDMMSPVEREMAKKVHDNMDQLVRAASQVDDTLFVMTMYLKYHPH